MTLRALLPAGLVALLLACGDDDAPRSGTARMAERLTALAGEAARENIYANDVRAAALRREVEAAGGDDAPFTLRAELAEELLYAGESEEAAALFRGVMDEIDERGMRLPAEVRDRLELQLALAWLRVGEQQNCLEHHTVDSCLLPIRGGGVHVEREGSEEALAVLGARLTRDAKDWTSLWLYNVAAMTLGRWPDEVPEAWLVPEQAFASEVDIGRFEDRAREAGLDVVGLAGGVVTEDLDGDGLLDLLVSSWGLEDPLRFLRNTGDGRWEDATAAAGLDGLTGGLNMVHADPDNDGDADVLVLRGAWVERGGGHPNSLLRNDGRARFDDATEELGLLSFHPTQTAAWGDYDDDGRLDLFIGNETGPHETHPCELFRNGDDGRFEDVAAASGLALTGYVKGAGWGDYDNDGDLDLYVSRIDGGNHLMRNDGPGLGGWVFRDVADRAGVREPKRSFPTWWFDVDNDGWLDLFVAGFRYGQTGWLAKDYLGRKNAGEKSRLYRNARDGTFEDVSAEAGLERVLPAMGANFGDLDNDGRLDMYLATGEPDYAALFPNRAFRNDRGRRFQDVTTAAGMGHVQKGHGVAFADLDDDGDQDVYAVMGGAYSGDVFTNVLFENPGHGHRWITLHLEGREANRAAIGARVRVRIAEPDGERDVHVVVGTGGSFGSSSLRQEIGLGDATRVVELEVRWPGSGRVQTWTDLPLDAALRVVEGEDAVRVAEPDG